MSLDPHVWPAGARRGDDGALSVAGVDLRDLAAEHGTPAYVLDEADFRARARGFREAFERAFAAVGAGVDVYYAGKAFLSVAVARWAHEEGLRIDTATGGELAVALRAGVPGADIGLHGNNKSDAEIERALAAGVGRIVVDSLGEVDRVADAAARAGVRAPVMVRLTTGVHAGGHEFIATAHEDQKFGLSLAGEGASPAMVALLAILARPELELIGVHSHIGSQILDPSGFEAAARRVLQLRAELAAATGHLLPEVDLGGGFGIAYLPGEVPLEPGRVAKDLAGVVEGACAELGTPLPRISIEPGRAIVGPTTLTLYRVGTVKPVTLEDGGTRTYVSVDGGMSDNLRPALYGARYTAALASRRGGATTVAARVVGKHCESGDIVVHDVALPDDVAPGDLLAVPATGAYGRSMASNYNHVPRPPVIAVRDGAARVIVRRETEDDLLALDLG
ncbi:diaminopimelate decarboxylase [Actinotalea fermentans]|uniref:Diaminopimelate decarboxylase n=1 Tax=Actinotalea fermentans TaxID=43671 RepID=A0A511YT38_9CELL|nr:diaminopimelate decarboxylase [Actinotalea fermentans]KGM17615.1 diaminopimelate decarboxylase [Actinotalea fermentans ATCC 43279 = JCM 9966 = DSM 3133]GEN78359.1 diaminopimelate decarboxylase [Actinotalea fermentans]